MREDRQGSSGGFGFDGALDVDRFDNAGCPARDFQLKVLASGDNIPCRIAVGDVSCVWLYVSTAPSRSRAPKNFMGNDFVNGLGRSGRRINACRGEPGLLKLLRLRTNRQEEQK